MPYVRAGLVAALLLGAVGCGSSEPAGPKSVPVTGTVTLDGKPLAGADIMFKPTTGTEGFGGIGRTEADGTYKMTSNDRSTVGVPPGAYRVIISRRIMPDGKPVPPNDPTPPIESPARESLPPTYSDLGGSTLTATVPEEGGTINFPLKRSGQ